VSIEVRATYEQLLAAWLDRHKYYPTTLRRRGIEGEGVLRVRLARDGHVTAVESVEGFGNPMLETVARDWIERADPFPAVPVEIGGSHYLVRFPVRFRLH
jgi:protein TonB